METDEQPPNADPPRAAVAALVAGALLLGWLLPDRDGALVRQSAIPTEATPLKLPARLDWVVWPEDRADRARPEGPHLSLQHTADDAPDAAVGACVYLGTPAGPVELDAVWEVRSTGGLAKVFSKVVRDGRAELGNVAAARRDLPQTALHTTVDAGGARLFLCAQIAGPGTGLDLEVRDGG